MTEEPESEAGTRHAGSRPPLGRERPAEFWKARAEALEVVATGLRTRILLLARVLPLDYLPYLEDDLDGLLDELPATNVLEGWVETTMLTPADVKTELALVWRRLSPDEGANP